MEKVSPFPPKNPPLRLSKYEWEKIHDQIIQERGARFALNLVLNRELGFTWRLCSFNFWDVYIDFNDENARTLFLLSFYKQH